VPGVALPHPSFFQIGNLAGVADRTPHTFRPAQFGHGQLAVFVLAEKEDCLLESDWRFHEPCMRQDSPSVKYIIAQNWCAATAGLRIPEFRQLPATGARHGLVTKQGVGPTVLSMWDVGVPTEPGVSLGMFIHSLHCWAERALKSPPGNATTFCDLRHRKVYDVVWAARKQPCIFITPGRQAGRARGGAWICPLSIARS
jgi:hypothetical protein